MGARAAVALTDGSRGHRYRPLVAREAAGRSALRRLLGTVFGGSRELLLTQLVDERGLSADELQRMRALLDERLGGTPATSRPDEARESAPNANSRAPRAKP